jgi:adenosylcobinamide-GDP ribazoletransferase
MFTSAPLPASWHRHATPADGRAAVRWLPAIGAALGALAGLVAAAALAVDGRATLLAAVLGIGALAWGTRGLHLDGLADTADGLGSRRPPAEALQVMRQSDIGPFGVLALVLVVLVDVAALARIGADGVWCCTAALAVAAATGRLAVLHATTPGVPAARTGGFGALVAGATAPALCAVATVIVLAGGAGVAALTPHASVIAWPCAQVGALLLARLFRWHAARRFRGVTGDVFGALIELTTAVTLIGVALS